MKKTPLFKTYIFLLLICTSCSSDSGDYSDDTLNNNSDNGDIVLTWETDRTYTTDIKVGETITWVWGSGRHNLVSISGPETFDSGYSSDNGLDFPTNSLKWALLSMFVNHTVLINMVL